jgi:hypothetical protein
MANLSTWRGSGFDKLSPNGILRPFALSLSKGDPDTHHRSP